MVENKKYSNYSVLMSVYYKEKAIHLDESMQSIFNQTILTNDFVLVCDGTLTSELDTVIGKYQKKYPNILNIKRLKTNKGLGNALNEGLNLCKNELVARMDSDDIAKIDRCEKELNAFNNNQNISIVGSAIEEFVENTNQVVNIKRVPSDYLEIIKFSKKRNPFNHPSVMFKKSDIISVGGYKETFHLFEDYFLWINLLSEGYRAINIGESLLYMRTSLDFYKRRGGWNYAKDMLKFHKWLLKINWASYSDFIIGAIPHAIVCIMPSFLRKYIYNFLRK